MMETGITIGADIGGSHITAAIVDTGSRQIIFSSHARQHISNNAGVQELIAGWAACIRKAGGDKKIEKVCLAMPGPFMYEEGICLIKDQNKYPGLYNVNVKLRLAGVLQLESSQIYMNNDAACFIHGEVFGGSLRGINSGIGITLGTGLGTAVYKDQNAVSADLWNMPFGESIAENYISSRWFTEKYFHLTGKIAGGVKELVTLAHTDQQVRHLFEEFGCNLAEFINRFIEKENPQAIVIGGNIAHAFPFFGERMLAAVVTINPNVKIFKSVLGENAALIGAVSSWLATCKRPMAG